MVLIALVVFGSGSFGIALGCILIAVALFNAFMLWQFPDDFNATYGNTGSNDAYKSSTQDGSFRGALSEEEGGLNADYQGPSPTPLGDDDEVGEEV